MKYAVPIAGTVLAVLFIPFVFFFIVALADSVRGEWTEMVCRPRINVSMRECPADPFCVPYYKIECTRRDHLFSL